MLSNLNDFYWQDEYGVMSFSERNLASVVRYIHNQKKHHADGTLIAAMERMDVGCDLTLPARG